MKTLINEIIKKENLIKMTFGQTRKKTVPYKKVIIRPIILHGAFIYQIEYHVDNKILHENLDNKEVFEKIFALLEYDFKQLNIFTKDNDIQILAKNIDNPK